MDPCRRGNDARGYTALHWAAHNANFTVVYILLAEVTHPRERWYGRRSRQCGRTPAEVMADSSPHFLLDEATLREWDASDSPEDDRMARGAEGNKCYSSASNGCLASIKAVPAEDRFRHMQEATSATSAEAISRQFTDMDSAPAFPGPAATAGALPMRLLLVTMCAVFCLRLSWQSFLCVWMMLGTGLVLLELTCQRHPLLPTTRHRAKNIAKEETTTMFQNGCRDPAIWVQCCFQRHLRYIDPPPSPARVKDTEAVRPSLFHQHIL